MEDDDYEYPMQPKVRDGSAISARTLPTLVHFVPRYR